MAPTCGHGRAYGQDSLVEKVEEEGFLSSQRLVTLAQALLRYLQISLLGLVPVKLAFVATPQVFILGLSRYTIPGYQSAAARRTCLVGPQPRSLCMLILSSKFAHDGMHASCRSGTARAVGGVGGGGGAKGTEGRMSDASWIQEGKWQLERFTLILLMTKNIRLSFDSCSTVECLSAAASCADSARAASSSASATAGGCRCVSPPSRLLGRLARDEGPGWPLAWLGRCCGG